MAVGLGKVMDLVTGRKRVGNRSGKMVFGAGHFLDATVLWEQDIHSLTDSLTH